MSIMPESGNDNSRINDSTGFSTGYAEGFLDAVTLKPSVPVDTVVAVARLAAGRTNLTDEQRTSILAALDWAAKSPASRRADCPDWCVIDHIHDDERDDLVLHQGEDYTDGTVRTLLGGHEFDVCIARTDSLTEGRIGTPALRITAEVELTTWEQAAQLARTILDAFGRLQGADA
jgi:hypothetical protein